MNAEEIKRQYSMREIAERYGLHPNRAGFIPCPFHKGDNTASMKIYKDSYYCFGCNTTGDIFSFIQNIDNCDFKTAFYSLGGTYEKQTKSSQIALYHLQKAREKRLKETEKIMRKIKHNNMIIGIYVTWLKRLEPLSDSWCDCMNELTKCIGKDEYLHYKLEGSDKN